MYKLESNFKIIATVRGSITDARAKAISLIGNKNMVVYVYRNGMLVGLVRDWYGTYQWSNGNGKSYFVGRDGKLNGRTR